MNRGVICYLLVLSFTRGIRRNYILLSINYLSIFYIIRKAQILAQIITQAYSNAQQCVNSQPVSAFTYKCAR